MPDPQQLTTAPPQLPPGMVLARPALKLPPGMTLARPAATPESNVAAGAVPTPSKPPVAVTSVDPSPYHEAVVNAKAAYDHLLHDNPIGRAVDKALAPMSSAISDWADRHPLLTSGAAKASLVLGAPTEVEVPDAAAAFAKAYGPANTQAAKDFISAIPPTKSNPYSLADYSAGRPFVETEHAINPVRKNVGVQDVVDNHNEAIGKIDQWVRDRIALTPNDTLPNDVMGVVKAKLAANAAGDKTYVARGLADLERFNINEDTTIPEADDIRQRLNAENKGILQRNNYKQATAREVDPGFFARETAAAQLREGIYDNLAARGTPGAQEMRQTQGSLIKVRNAAEAQVFNGDKVVRGSNTPNLAQKLADQALPSAGRALLPKGVNNLITPEDLTRNELAARSFNDAPSVQPMAKPGGPIKALPEPQPTGQLPLAPRPPAAPTPEANPQLGLFNTEPAQVRGGPGTSTRPMRLADTVMNRPVQAVRQVELPPYGPENTVTLRSLKEQKMLDWLMSKLPANIAKDIR